MEKDSSLSLYEYDGLRYFRFEYDVGWVDEHKRVFWCSLVPLFEMSRCTGLDLVVYKDCDKIVVLCEKGAANAKER